MDIVVRDATLEDMMSILNLHGQLINYECQYYYLLKKFEDFSKDNIEALKKNIEKIINDKERKVLVAIMNHEIVGFAHGYIKKAYFYIANILELEEIVVDEKHRRLGIAEKLYNKLIDWGKENNAEELHLNVFHENTNAVKFYKKMKLEQHSMKMKGKL